MIWAVTTSRAAWLTPVISPYPTVLNVVTVKYSASVRVRCWLKLPGAARPIAKYAEANSSRNNGTVVASASAARTPGYVALESGAAARQRPPPAAAAPPPGSPPAARSPSRSSGSK